MVYIHKHGATVLMETLGIKNRDLKDKFMFKSLRLSKLPGYRGRPQTAICCLEWFGRLKCLATGLYASFSLLQRKPGLEIRWFCSVTTRRQSLKRMRKPFTYGFQNLLIRHVKPMVRLSNNATQFLRGINKKKVEHTYIRQTYMIYCKNNKKATNKCLFTTLNR